MILGVLISILYSLVIIGKMFLLTGKLVKWLFMFSKATIPEGDVLLRLQTNSISDIRSYPSGM